MSTNATIVRKVDDVTYHAVYLHWDGYPDHALTTLKENYNTDELVEKLLSYGDMSELAENTDKCVFYFRDKGEPCHDVALIEVNSIPELNNYFENPHTYLFIEGEWLEIKP